MIAWNEEKCAGCGICILFCPVDAMKSLGTIQIDADKCNDCLACFEACPVDALGEGK
jgi:ferredoxin